MKLICPGCGAVCSAESFLNDGNARETLQIVSRLPAPLPKVVLNYLSLFRPGKSALSWKKALRLAGEIEELVARGYVSRQGLPDRKCSARTWAKGMEQMIEQRAFLTLPMPNHNYLRKVAYDMADQMDYQQEKTRQKSSLYKGTRPSDHADPSLDPLEKARREWDEKMKKGEVAEVDLTDLKGVVKGMD